MLAITEQEKISYFDYVVIKPIGLGSSAGHSMGGSSAGDLNKGHIVNAGVLYILESGLMKILSTSGAQLIEKNVGFELAADQDHITSVLSSPNPEDMFVMILSEKGKVFTYQIKLERQVDATNFLRSNSSDSESDLEHSNLSKDELKKLKKAQFQKVAYEYVFDDSTDDDLDLPTLL